MRNSIVLWLSPGYDVVVDDESRVRSWTDQSVNAHVAKPVGSPESWPVLVGSEMDRPRVRFGVVLADNNQTPRRLRIADHRSLQFGVTTR